MKLTKRLFSLVVVIGAVLLVSGSGFADLYVDDDYPSCCDGSCYSADIQTAINAASSETVYVCPGTYTEQITMKNGVDVISVGGSTPTSYTGSGHTTTVYKRAVDTIIDGGGAGEVVLFDGRTSSFNTETLLDGFTVQNVDSTTTEKPLIGITADSGYAKVTYCIIRDNQGTDRSGGISSRGRWNGSTYDTAPTIEHNVIHDVSGPGIGNGPYSHAIIRYNEIWDCNGSDAPGIGLRQDTYPTIEDNTIFENDQSGIGSTEEPLEAKGSTLTIPAIKGNTIYDNTAAGIRLERLSTDTTGTITVTIGESDGGAGYSNEIYSNGTAGIRLGGDIDNATIIDNWIYQNIDPIRVDAVDTVTIQENHVDSNTRVGININGQYGDVGDAFIKDNVIHGNGWAGIAVEQGSGTTNISIDDNQIYSNGSALGRPGIFIDDSFDQIIIKHNTIYGNTTAGIRTSDGDASGDVIIAENDIDSNGTAGIRISEGVGGSENVSAEIIGNTLETNTNAGIVIDNGTGTIAQNYCSSNGTAGIVFGNYASQGAAADFSVIKNRVCLQPYQGGIAIYQYSPIDPPSLDIIQNKAYDQGYYWSGGGIQVIGDTGTVTIQNNLSHDNGRGGIRFGASATVVKNNTAVDNGSRDGDELGYGGGIIYSDELVDSTYYNYYPTGTASSSLVLKNNICTHNTTAGLRVGAAYYGTVSYPCPDPPGNVDYNLLFKNFAYSHIGNFWWEADAGDDGTCWGGTKFMCAGQQMGGCFFDPSVGFLEPNSIFADPLFVNKSADDYHLQSVANGYPADSPAIGTGENGVDMGCYGGAYPINDLMDIDTSTGNTNSDGSKVTFDLGATASYTITDVRLYTSSASMNWDVYVGGSLPASTKVKDDWGMSSAGWHETTVTQQSGIRYIRLQSNSGDTPVTIPAGAILEFSYKRNEDTTTYWDGSQFWRAPSIAVAGSTYTDIDG